MIIRQNKRLFGTTEILLLSESSGTIIKRLNKALYIYIDRKVIRGDH